MQKFRKRWFSRKYDEIEMLKREYKVHCVFLVNFSEKSCKFDLERSDSWEESSFSYKKIRKLAVSNFRGIFFLAERKQDSTSIIVTSS